MRIVSLLPSTTEILFAIGAGDDVVGVTFECDFPPEARTRRIVSTSAMPEESDPARIDAAVRARLAAGEDLYHLDGGALADLRPDLVVTQDLCAVCAVDVKTVEGAMDYLGCDGTVLTIDPSTLADVVDSVAMIGSAVGRRVEAARLVAVLRSRLDASRAAVAGRPRPRVVVLEWTAPPFDAGHWVPDMIEAAGGLPVLGTPGGRSQKISWGAVAACTPDVVIVSPCGYRLDGACDLARDLLRESRIPPAVPVWAVDADAAFVRPGPRLVDGVEALAGVLHPGAVPSRPDLVTRLDGLHA